MLYLHCILLENGVKKRYTGENGQAVKMQDELEGDRYLKTLEVEYNIKVIDHWYTEVPLQNSWDYWEIK